MTMAHQLAAHWLVRSLGWTLLHFCWQGASIALLLWCTLQLLTRRPAQQRYLATCIALGLMIFLPLATLTQIGLHEYRLAAELRASALPDDTSLVLQAGLGDGASWLAGIAAALDPYLSWVLLAWLGGLVVSLVRLSVGLRLALRMQSAAVSQASASLGQMFDSLQQRLFILRPVRLMVSGLVQVPTVVGWLRPMVLIPVSCFTGLAEEQIEAILCHELAHIRRHDYLVSIVQSVVEAVLFYHPAVWWVSQQVRRERECCCDDLAVHVGGNALSYAKALSTLEARRGSYPQVVLGSNGGELTMRIKRLLQCEEVSAVPQVVAVLVLLLLTVAAGAIAGTARAEARPETRLSLHAGVRDTSLASQPAATKASVSPNAARAGLAGVATLTRTPKPAVSASVVSMADERRVVDASPAAQQPDQPLKVAGGVLAGQIHSKVSPIYPAEAKAACVQGTVALRAIISKTGAVENLQVVSGPHELYTSALDAVRQWTYQPYLLNGQPVEVDTTINVTYSMTTCPTAENDAPDASGVAPKAIGGAVSAPVLVSAPAPEYTADARAAKISGTVLVHFWVDESGTPTHVKLVRGLGNGLDAKAIEAVSRYRFTPAMENGKPVVVALNTEINFNIF